MPIKKEIIYPIFLECCQFTDDLFWENIFEELAYGKGPYGTYISKGFLCCSYKNKEFSYKITRKDPKIIFDEIYGLLTEKLGILSYKEKAQKKLVFHEVGKNIKNSRQEWSNIRKKNIKDAMYEKYVIDMKKEYKLTIKQCKFLLSMIMLSIIFKSISSKDITFKYDKIEHIEGIEFNKTENGTYEINFLRPLCYKEDNISTDIIEEYGIKTMRENWEKYLKTEYDKLS